ncbi:maltoporin [Vibrio sp. SS-MA-C1-2]|uniref:maltoporin n=1 Tax=Vibrio sp. SS-MA-C1-2 TaxID=2908646 RepID=UPI001F4619A7|nr:maltoporin [Vibrio sp. SS-MA-C1-2]UJF18650.1 maltoporin [Vibrio sp. SS-MA-C1-2]
MKFGKICLTAAAVSAALMSASSFAAAGPTDFFGYMRAGVGVSGANGGQTQYEKNNVGRLGNENDVYGEIGIGKDVFQEDDLKFRVNSMIAVTSNGSNDWEGTEGDDAQFALRQFNVESQGILNFAPEATLWAGKRYYQRHDIHITDRYYWDISGAGAGVENIEVGPGKLAVAWVRSDNSGDFNSAGAADGPNDQSINVNIVDVRYAGINLWSGAQLELGLDYAITNPTSSQNDLNTNNGLMFTAEMTQSLLGGFNKTVVQFGTEGYAAPMVYGGAGSWYGVADKDDASAYRLINHGVISLNERWDISHQLLWASTMNDLDKTQDGDVTNFSAVIRPEFKWDAHHKTIFEAGYYNNDSGDIESTKQVANTGTHDADDDWVPAEYTTETAQDSSGQKFTLAQAWSAGDSFWARPEFRLYASYLMDNDNANAFKGGDFKAGDATEWNFGIQVEAWW